MNSVKKNLCDRVLYVAYWANPNNHKVTIREGYEAQYYLYHLKYVTYEDFKCMGSEKFKSDLFLLFAR